MTNYSHGHYAEKVAASYLKNLGYKIVDTNWRTRWCEIDIIAQKSKIVYFVEVKYRITNDYGEGLDYINKSKQKQMTRAAESWIQLNPSENEVTLAAIEVSGKNYIVTNFIDSL